MHRRMLNWRGRWKHGVNKMAFFKKDELKLLWPFYLDALLINISFIYPAFMILYFMDIGLSLTQIGFLISSSALAGVLFEIPTGAIADLFGRKLSTILGFFLVGLVIISIMFSKNFYLLFGLFFIWGAFDTLISGAKDSWIVDLVKYKKRKELVQEYFIKKNSFYSFSFLLTGIIGALLVKRFGLRIIWPISGISVILTSIVFLFGKENFIRKKQHIKEHTKELISHSKESIKYSLNHQGLLLILIAVIIFVFVVSLTSDITWYPFLQGLGFQDHWFGYLFSGTFVLGIFVPYLTKTLSKKLGGHKKYLVIILSLMAFLSFLVGFINSMVLAIIIFILFMSMYDFFHPINNALFHKFVPGKMRATIDSFRNMAASLIAIISFPLVGFLADNIGPQRTIVLGAFVLIPAIILYSKINE